MTRHLSAREKDSLRRRISHAQAMQNGWLRLLESGAGSAKQRGVWRSCLTRWQHQEAALRARLEGGGD